VTAEIENIEDYLRDKADRAEARDELARLIERFNATLLHGSAGLGVWAG
jgi:hypothetical protein